MISARKVVRRPWMAAVALALLAVSNPAAAQNRGQPRDTAHTAPTRRDTTRARSPAQDTSHAAPAVRDSSRRGREPITLPPVTLVMGTPPASPWHGYYFRSIAYAGVAGFGLLLTTHKTSRVSEICTGPPTAQDCVDRTVVSHPSAGLGSAMAAAAVLAGVGDAVLTSRRAHARPTSARTGLLWPGIEADGDAVRLSLVRWVF